MSDKNNMLKLILKMAMSISAGVIVILLAVVFNICRSTDWVPHWDIKSIFLLICPLILPSIVCLFYYVYRLKLDLSETKKFNNKIRFATGTMTICITYFAVVHLDALFHVQDAPGGFIALFFPIFAIFYGLISFMPAYMIGNVIDYINKKTHNKRIQ